MEAKAHLRYVRISPRKIQIVCDLIRGKSVAQATAILMNTPMGYKTRKKKSRTEQFIVKHRNSK